jgi:hypothetical protein
MGNDPAQVDIDRGEESRFEGKFTKLDTACREELIGEGFL